MAVNIVPQKSTKRNQRTPEGAQSEDWKKNIPRNISRILVTLIEPMRVKSFKGTKTIERAKNGTRIDLTVRENIAGKSLPFNPPRKSAPEIIKNNAI